MMMMVMMMVLMMVLMMVIIVKVMIMIRPKKNIWVSYFLWQKLRLGKSGQVFFVLFCVFFIVSMHDSNIHSSLFSACFQDWPP